MEALILLGSAAVGYFLNKDGKQDRTPNQDVKIPGSSKPMGPLIYDSHRLEEVDDYTRRLAQGKAQERVKRMFPDTYKLPNSVVSSTTLDSTLGNNYADLTDLTGNAQYFFDASQASVASFNTNIYPSDPHTGKPITKPFVPLQNDKPYVFKGPKTVGDQPISALSGLPLDMSHGNEQPSFGASVKQQGLGNSNGQVMLELFTGIPSSDNFGTYARRTEVALPSPSNPDPVMRPGYSQVPDALSRVAVSIRPTNDYISPVKKVRDLPISQDVQVRPLGIDQTRRVGDQQISYTTPVIEGQKGITRAMLPSVPDDNKWSLLTELKAQDVNPNRSQTTVGVNSAVPSVRENKGTLEFAQDYMGPSGASIKTDSSTQISASQLATLKNSLFNPLIYTPELGVASNATIAGRTTGVLLLRTPLSDSPENYLGQAFQNSGYRSQDIAPPSVPVKGTYPEDQNSGQIGGIGTPGGLYGDTTYDVGMTNKEMNAESGYLGQAHRDQGQGGRDSDYSLNATLKEMNLFSQIGNPTGVTSASKDTDAEYDNAYDSTMNSVLGIATSDVKRVASDGGELTNLLSPELLVEGYYHNPSQSNSGKVDRDQIKNGISKTTNRPDFGNYFSAGTSTKLGELNRDIKTKVKDDSTVAGRAGPALKRDNPKSGLQFDYECKDDTGHAATTYQRRLPTISQVNSAAITTRSKNTEVLNPRFDPGTKITSDLFPYS